MHYYFHSTTVSMTVDFCYMTLDYHLLLRVERFTLPSAIIWPIGRRKISVQFVNSLLVEHNELVRNLCHILSRPVTSRHTLSHRVTSRHVTFCHITSRPVTSCHTMPHPVTSCQLLRVISEPISQPVINKNKSCFLLRVINVFGDRWLTKLHFFTLRCWVIG